MSKFLIILFVLFQVGFSQLVIDYGFEDWTGDANTTPNYIFSTNYQEYWQEHLASTEVVQQSSVCGDRAPFEGKYYLHRNFWTGGFDPCLNSQATSINARMQIGVNGRYPLNSGNDVELRTAITKDTLTFRFYFRTTGDWKNQSSMGKCKFFRLYGTGGGSDPSSLIIHYNAGNTNSFQIYDPSNLSYGPNFYPKNDMQDGNWHSMVVVVIINNHTNDSGNITAIFWIDDWDMKGNPLGSRTITAPAFGDRFSYIDLQQNWSATYPSSSMGIDIDKIQLWNGLPSYNTNLNQKVSPKKLKK